MGTTKSLQADVGTTLIKVWLSVAVVCGAAQQQLLCRWRCTVHMSDPSTPPGQGHWYRINLANALLIKL
jgi:hypothetical protein